MRLTAFVVLLLIGSSVFAADGIASANEGDNILYNSPSGYKEYKGESDYYEVDKVLYAEKDFSRVLMPTTEFLGFIGDNYQKLDVVFTSVERDKQNPYTYLVKGYSTTKGNKQSFAGNIVIKKIGQVDPDGMHYTDLVVVPEEMENCTKEGIKECNKEGIKEYVIEHGYELTNIGDGIKAEGILEGEYMLAENPKEKHSGKFSGKMYLIWYINKNDNLLPDHLSPSDDASNNQYNGRWSAYHSKVTKVANWGEYRIPDSGDLDIGAGDFGVNPKYYKNGWGDQ